DRDDIVAVRARARARARARRICGRASRIPNPPTNLGRSVVERPTLHLAGSPTEPCDQQPEREPDRKDLTEPPSPVTAEQQRARKSNEPTADEERDPGGESRHALIRRKAGGASSEPERKPEGDLDAREPDRRSPPPWLVAHRDTIDTRRCIRVRHRSHNL